MPQPKFCQDGKINKFILKILYKMTNAIFPISIDFHPPPCYTIIVIKEASASKKGTDTMRDIRLFKRELSLIKNDKLREIISSYLENATSDYFWTDGASSSGKYHPEFAQGVGGLVRHTKAVVMFAEELLKMSSYAFMREEYKDYVIAACIIHDTCKYGMSDEMDKSEYKNHAENAAQNFVNWSMYEYDYCPSELLLNAVKAHMGQWSTNKEDRPFTNIDRCVHLADYIASRNFIDIPSITADYKWCEYEHGKEENEIFPFEFAEGA